LGHANEHGISANTRFEVCIAKDYPETGFDLAAFFGLSLHDMDDMGDPAARGWFQFVTHTGGGLFACPRGIAQGEFVGQRLFETSRP